MRRRPERLNETRRNGENTAGKSGNDSVNSSRNPWQGASGAHLNVAVRNVTNGRWVAKEQACVAAVEVDRNVFSTVMLRIVVNRRKSTVTCIAET